MSNFLYSMATPSSDTNPSQPSSSRPPAVASDVLESQEMDRTSWPQRDSILVSDEPLQKQLQVKEMMLTDDGKPIILEASPVSMVISHRHRRKQNV